MDLFLHHLLVVENEIAHFAETEVMWNIGVELVGQMFDVSSVFLSPQLVHQFLQYAIPLLDVLLGELSQWHFLDVVADQRHLLFHHVDVEDQFDQFLGGGGQFAFLKLFLMAVVAVFGVIVILFLAFLVLSLVVQLYLLVAALLTLLSVFAVIVPDGCINRNGTKRTVLSPHSHSSPARIHIARV